MRQGHVGDGTISTDAFEALFHTLNRWGLWGERDERGALRYLTAQRVAAAAQLVHEGISVSLSLPLNTQQAVYNPQPAIHYMTSRSGGDMDASSLHVVKDYIGVDYHNDGHTHIDALSHIAYHGQFYNAQPESAVTAEGATVHAIDTLKDGLVGRGVLLDIPRARGVPWLEPGEHVFRDDLEVAERSQGITVSEGDILLVRTGHTRRLNELGPWDTSHAKAGLHVTTMPFLAERHIAALGCDGNSDTAPSGIEGLGFPIHVLAINAMGMLLLDYLQLEDLRAICERSGRWEFLFVAAPLRIVGGTGSPINPLALF